MMNISRTLRIVISRTLLIVSLAFVPFSLFAATPLDINTATAAEFAAVMSGVGEKKAEAIVAFREANGNFESIEQLAQVKGIGDVLLTRNKPLLRVSVEEETSLN